MRSRSGYGILSRISSIHGEVFIVRLDGVGYSDISRCVTGGLE